HTGKNSISACPNAERIVALHYRLVQMLATNIRNAMLWLNVLHSSFVSKNPTLSIKKAKIYDIVNDRLDSFC
ncbi:MAG: hypothetical protein ACU84J_11700, partial [Gammaproteobacteria bacterium]